jgi:hypothetical protein
VIKDRTRRWAATDGDIKANGGVGTCVVDLRWGDWSGLKEMSKGCVGGSDPIYKTILAICLTTIASFLTDQGQK